MKIANDLTELIGNTPLLSLNRFGGKISAKGNILAKLECMNPLGSVKDRVGYYLIKDGIEKGKINSDTVLIEPTSGNTGIGLAFTATIYGLKLILTMPETMSVERRKLLKALGAEIVLTKGELGMAGAIEKAVELSKEYKNSYIPQQFENPANVEAHVHTTALEILKDTDGKVDYFISAVGTGGTLTGNAKVLKKEVPGVKIIAVEPFSSQVLAGKQAGPHKIQGIGANFVPKILDRTLIDEIIPVTDEDAFSYARLIGKTEGVLCGISSGAALCAAAKIALRPENEGKNIVVILPDGGEKYLSTPLFEE